MFSTFSVKIFTRKNTCKKNIYRKKTMSRWNNYAKVLNNTFSDYRGAEMQQAIADF